MRLKPIFETSGSEEYKKILSDLKEKYGKNYLSAALVSDDYTTSGGYGRKSYRGTLKKGVEITELELSMMCDNGFSYFGGTSTINSDGSFFVDIWID